MQELYRELEAMGRVLQNEPMSAHTTFKVGGNADLVFMPASANELKTALYMAKSRDIPCIVLGNGSNVIVRDKGIRGLTVILGERMSDIRIDGDIVTAQAGALMSRVASAAQAAGLSGMEFMSGIPGTLGGGAAMNAGAYGGQISDILIDAEALIDGELKTLTNAEMRMGYRTTYPLEHGHIITRARFKLTRGDSQGILARMKELNAKRRDKQPLDMPSAGSAFRRPEGYFAGALIEAAGMKGAHLGGAMVSPKHAGFIVNTGSACASDVIELMLTVQMTVFDKTGIMLEPEIRVVGED